jgi:hypothetical protein
VLDEGSYWESKNEDMLRRQFDRYNFLLDAVQNVLQDFKAVPGETVTSLTDRLEVF